MVRKKLVGLSIPKPLISEPEHLHFHVMVLWNLAPSGDSRRLSYGKMRCYLRLKQSFNCSMSLTNIKVTLFNSQYYSP